MTNAVFTYGSLMFAPVWTQVVRGSYRSAPALLFGYRRFALADDTYPGMVEEGGAQVEGLVYFDVDDADLARLDDFEGNEYRRIAVSLALPAGADADAGPARRIDAQTYLFTAVQRLSASAWDPDAFALERFMGSYCRDKLG